MTAIKEINFKNLTKEDVGKYVTYKGYERSKYGNWTSKKIQKGRIKSWNDTFVFVVFHCDGNWDKFQDYTGMATNSEDLIFYSD